MVRAGVMALVLGLECSRAAIPSNALVWAMLGVALVAVAMAVRLLTVPGTRIELALRATLGFEGGAGMLLITRRLRRRNSHDGT